MLALFACLLAQAGAIDSKYLTLTPSTALQAAPGGRVTLDLAVVPKPKIHVYAPGQPDYIPISLTVDASPVYRRAGGPRYPKSETLFFEPLNERFKVYSKPFRITQDVILTEDARANTPDGVLVVKGKVSYQACDDLVCYRPVDVPVAWTVRLTAPK